ncbi:MAG: maltose alpha-D-glucosyltransferase [Anaerolineaceae bacterium]|nr:maltose alpha-D-glucosyltransferase [Anaerolineaceae bacterium]
MPESNLPWYMNAIFYEVYVRSFADGNGDGIGDIRGLTDRLDYFVSLGVDCLWLLPIYPSPMVDDGYDIADYYAIHPDYGTMEDFKTFLVEAHRRGLRVIADLVVNHTSDQHPWFQAARSSRTSPFRDYYIWSDTDQLYQEARIIFVDSQKSNWEWDPQTQQFYFHRFFPQQPDLNYDNPAVRQGMLDIMRYWLDLGLDGFRADAVPYLFKRSGTTCENLPETHAYLKELRKEIDTQYQERILLAEANQWPRDVRTYFGSGDEFNLAFNFPLMPRLYMSLALQDYRPVVNISQATPPIPDNCQWCTFLRNHDELTLEMVTPEERELLWNIYAPEPRMRLNLGIRRRLAPLMDGDRRKIELLNSILFTLPGSPIIYYGDEIGMGDSIWLKDRDGVRTPMQWDASLNAGFSNAPPDRLYDAIIDDERFGYQHINVEQQRADSLSLWHTIRRMIAIRKQFPVFSQGAIEFIQGDNLSILAFVRKLGISGVCVIHNLSEDIQSIDIPLQFNFNSPLRDLLTHQEYPLTPDGRLQFFISPYQSVWLSTHP